MNTISKALEISPNNFCHSQETISFTAEILLSMANISSNANKAEICKRLFKILAPNKIFGKYPRIFAYMSISLMEGMLFYFLFFPALLLSSMMLSKVDIFTIYKKQLFNQTEKRVSIWLHCCTQLEIPQSTVARIVPLKFISFLKADFNNPFNKLIRRKVSTPGSKDSSELNKTHAHNNL